MTRVSVIIPARDAGATIGRTLACVERQTTQFGFETIVVDDGSADDTVAVVRAAGLDVTLIEQDREGAAEARNRGVAAASGELLAFIDSDCYPPPGWLAAGVAALEAADLVQGEVTPDPGADQGPFDRTLWVTEHNGLWQTANLFVTRELFDRVGGFDDWLEVEIGKLMAEDVWFGWRVRRAGGRSAFSAAASLHHEVFARGARGYLDERRRVRYFPAMVAKMPELRATMLFRRLFLSRRTAAFDLGVAGTVIAAATRSRLPLLAWVPYVRLAWAERLRGRGPAGAASVAAVDAAADLLALAELTRGSLRTSTPVL